MKLINQDTDYGIKALLALARRPGKVTSVSALAEELGVPHPYLRKILQVLARKGLVRSFKGRGGGFILGRPAAQIVTADVVRIFQGEIGLHDCLFKKRICPDVATCPLRTAVGRLEQRLVKDLEALSIALILKDDQGRRAAKEKGVLS